jgi:hypothetical protein
MRHVYVKGSTLLLVLFMILSFSACGRNVENIADSAANAVSSAGRALGQLIEGDVTGEIGKDYRTRWFSFNIESIKEVTEYAGYAPQDGNVLMDVVVTETCIYEEAIPMGTFDFYMDADNFLEYIYPVEETFDDTMMPLEFELAPDETVTYHMLYEIPTEHENLTLKYTEIAEDEAEYATFTIKLGL